MKNKITVIIMTIFFAALSLWCVFGKKSNYSDSERRELAKAPIMNMETLQSGKFASDFESYAVDHFPARDTFRSIKAYVRLYLFRQSDNNGLYQNDSHISKLEYPENPEMREHASTLFTKIDKQYLGNNQVYFSMIPDKNCYLGELKLDYKKFEQDMTEALPFATPIHIADLMSREDFYKTDTHWRQEQIVDVAKKLATSMGCDLPSEYQTVSPEHPFYGVYAGQSALNVKPDTICYLTNAIIENYEVTITNQFGMPVASDVYNMEKLKSKDPYEMFLSGNQSIVTIKNPESTSAKRLIIFRDSFGSSIAPLLAQGYSETVLVDLRYISSDMLGTFVDFENADVLFLYSTLLLNNSLSMK